jgi:hypothetical protein
MSAALQLERPVRAHVTVNGKTRVEQVTLMDGSMVVSPEDLALLGNGSAEKGRYQLRLMIAMERQPARQVVMGPTEKPATVRAAVPADEAALLELLMLDVKENAEQVAPPDEGRIMAHIMHCTRRKGGIAGVIDGPDGKPVACNLLVNCQWWWSNSWYYQELVLFVHPEHRKSNHLRDLLNFQRWVSDAQTKGFGYRVYLMCGVLGVSHVREKIMLYRRKFRQAGAVFVYPSPFAEDK